MYLTARNYVTLKQMDKLSDDYIYSVHISYTLPLVYNISPDYKSAYILCYLSI